MKTIIRLVKKILFALSIIYGFNLIMNPLKILIPINIYTIITTSVFGFPGLLILVGLKLIV